MNPYKIIVEWKQHLKETIAGITLFLSVAVLTQPSDYADWVFLVLFWFSFVWSVKYIVRFEIESRLEAHRRQYVEVNNEK